MRLLNILVIGALILAASFVYKIKFDSTLQAERVAKLRGELRRERSAIATLRAEWARLDTPCSRSNRPSLTNLIGYPIGPPHSLQRPATIRSAPCSHRFLM